MSNPEWWRANAGWIVAAILFFGQLVWFASRVWYQVKQHGKSLEGLGEQTVGGRIDREVNGPGQRIDREVNHEPRARFRTPNLHLAAVLFSRGKPGSD